MTPGDPLTGAWTGARWPGTITGNVISNTTFTIGVDIEARMWDDADLTAPPPAHTIQIEPSILPPCEPPLAEDPYITFWKGESAL